MTPADRFAEVADGLYDAALDAERWPGVLRDLAELVGGCAAGLVRKDIATRAGDVIYQYGASERFIDLYRTRYWRHDPLAPLFYFRTGRLVTTGDVMPIDEFRDGPFYREWALPQDFGEAINIPIDRSATTVTFLSLIVGRGEEDGIGETRDRLGRLAAHVRRAAIVGQAIEIKASETRTLADTLDRLSAAIFQLRQDGMIVHANAAARALLASCDPLGSTRGRLVLRDIRANAALAEALAAAGRPGTGAASASLALATTTGDCYLAHVLPITSGTRRQALDVPAAVAALVVRKATLELPASPPELLARHFRLTPSELRVLLALVDGGSVREVAESLGLAGTTVKTHLAHLFAKTGATRQADLIRLVAGFSSPLLN